MIKLKDMTKEDYSKCVKVKEDWIDYYISQALDIVVNKDASHYNISTGDMSVVVIKHDSEIQLYVNTSDGFFKKNIYKDREGRWEI